MSDRSRILIVGGGHIGSLVGIELLKHGHAVHIVTAADKEKLRNGRILSSQCIWSTTREIEERICANIWQEEYSGISGFEINWYSRNSKKYSCQQAFETAGMSIDQRVKVSRYLEYFEELGGTTSYDKIDEATLFELSSTYDLTIVTAGKFSGTLGEAFPIDNIRSRYAAPQRVGAVLYLKNRKQDLAHPNNEALEEWTHVEGVGDFFAIPAYSHSGLCHIVCFEAFISDETSRFFHLKTPQEILDATKNFFIKNIPGERERWANAELIDPKAAIAGGGTPTVRKQIFESEKLEGKPRPIFLFGDAHVMLDPLTAQGANTHIKNIDYLVTQINQSNSIFSQKWLNDLSEYFLNKVTKIENVQHPFLVGDPSVEKIFKKADADESFATNWINTHFNNPEELQIIFENAKE